MTSSSRDITKPGAIFASVFTLPGSEIHVLYLVQDITWVGLLVKAGEKGISATLFPERKKGVISLLKLKTPITLHCSVRD